MKEGVPTTGVCCTQTQWVTSSFLQAAGIAVIQGRGFTPTDEAGAPAVALISEGLARKFPGGMQPVGQYLTSAEDGGKDNSDRRLIVGVVRDVRDLTLERPALPAIYLPMEERGASALTLVARTSVDPISIAGAVQKAIQNQAGPAVITDVLTFEDLMLKSVAPRHLNAWLFGSFGVVGLLLAVVGIGSVVSYSVSRRTREMGLRLALGARPQDVGLLVVRESMVPVLAGLIVGLGAAMALSRFVDAFLFEVAPRDVWTYVIVCVVLAVAAALAAVLPARRAARVDPLVALRAE
jgi:putative ABC transport system permease protein